MPRFAVLAHDHPFPHWDLLLEAGESCRTWRLLEEPGPGRAVAAEPLPDHRPHYLTYEGPVGGNRGTVTRWDAGAFEWISDDGSETAVELSGARLRGACSFAWENGAWRATFAGS